MKSPFVLEMCIRDRAGSSAGNVIASVEGQDASASRVCFRFDLRKQQEAHIGNPDSTTAKTVLVNEEG